MYRTTRIIVVASLGAVVLILSTAVSQRRFQPFKWEQYVGWSRVKAALADKKGNEFVRRLPNVPRAYFKDQNEFRAVLKAADWVASHLRPRRIPTPPGIVFGDAAVLYDEIANAVYFHNGVPADEVSWATLLCSFLRFHTMGGIPAERVYVAVAVHLVPRRRQVRLVRSWVAYLPPQAQNWWHLLPQYGENKYASKEALKRALRSDSPQPGNTVLFYFNDLTVRGGDQLFSH